MTSKQIYDTAIVYFGRDFTKTRKRENVYTRALVNDICKKLTKESLESIGKNTKRDHATVLNSIKTFNELYIKQKDPFDVSAEYISFEIYLKSGFDDYIHEVMYYKELKRKYDILEIKYANLKVQHEMLIKENQKQKHHLEERFIPLIDECSKFSNKQLDGFIQTRVKPFKLMSQIK